MRGSAVSERCTGIQAVHSMHRDISGYIFFVVYDMQQVPKVPSMQDPESFYHSLEGSVSVIRGHSFRFGLGCGFARHYASTADGEPWSSSLPWAFHINLGEGAPR